MVPGASHAFTPAGRRSGQSWASAGARTPPFASVSATSTRRSRFLRTAMPGPRGARNQRARHPDSIVVRFAVTGVYAPGAGHGVLRVAVGRGFAVTLQDRRRRYLAA